MNEQRRIMWTAAFLEGEGCFYSGAKNHSRVRASQVQRWPLERLVEYVGGYIDGPKRNHRGRPIHEWHLSGPAGRGLMFTLYQFMSPLRRSQIRASIARWKEAPKQIAELRRTATHCRNGHRYQGNCYSTRKGRRCRTCSLAASDRYVQRLRELAPKGPTSQPPASWMGR